MEMNSQFIENLTVFFITEEEPLFTLEDINGLANKITSDVFVNKAKEYLLEQDKNLVLNEENLDKLFAEYVREGSMIVKDEKVEVFSQNLKNFDYSSIVASEELTISDESSRKTEIQEVAKALGYTLADLADEADKDLEKVLGSYPLIGAGPATIKSDQSRTPYKVFSQKHGDKFYNFLPLPQNYKALEESCCFYAVYRVILAQNDYTPVVLSVDHPKPNDFNTSDSLIAMCKMLYSYCNSSWRKEMPTLTPRNAKCFLECLKITVLSKHKKLKIRSTKLSDCHSHFYLNFLGKDSKDKNYDVEMEAIATLRGIISNVELDLDLYLPKLKYSEQDFFKKNGVKVTKYSSTLTSEEMSIYRSYHNQYLAPLYEAMESKETNAIKYFEALEIQRLSYNDNMKGLKSFAKTYNDRRSNRIKDTNSNPAFKSRNSRSMKFKDLLEFYLSSDLTDKELFNPTAILEAIGGEKVVMPEEATPEEMSKMVEAIQNSCEDLDLGQNLSLSIITSFKKYVRIIEPAD
jgi:hypothetical protein